MDNRYLKDRAARRRNRRGQYMRDSKRMRGMDSRDYYPEYPDREYREYDMGYQYPDGHYPMERYGEYHRPHGYYAKGMIQPMYYHDMGMDFAKEKDEYEEALHEWVSKLKHKETRFGWTKDQVISQAKTMGVKFDEFDEMEFYAIYLALVTDHPKAAAEPRAYLNMAKEWLMDDDVKRTGSEKVCAYLYSIVLGEDD